mmetsp:Transcript_11408/g.24522  ORF Transcript_11408/g.24522 Transcript_11408/m.24522 type:complete len:487 (+) Transcript_11408:294-1754(+)|eukprot:CAMPEP_0202897508 /NCGR_PEP_ID=MMETSP1392-20130828/6249_1 /ASSEMBLY_ACC=CAM_ASM_000868 /TAXON_ID=225041 /ORGANISM="Chlamydomonas chlamydogama, Strain SAG 11-48b" /LENGTH=486 /DNA_ID=CAMNT_0049583171 /DNA_START=208 /DNA_END=1668 /DNA_ORIENTATION=+
MDTAEEPGNHCALLERGSNPSYDAGVAGSASAAMPCELQGDTHLASLRKSRSEPSLDDLDCAICTDLLYEPVVGRCGHAFCKACVVSYRESLPSGTILCPLCRCEMLGASTSLQELGVCRRLQALIERAAPKLAAKRKAVNDELRCLGIKRRQRICEPATALSDVPGPVGALQIKAPRPSSSHCSAGGTPTASFNSHAADPGSPMLNQHTAGGPFAFFDAHVDSDPNTPRASMVHASPFSPSCASPANCIVTARSVDQDVHQAAHHRNLSLMSTMTWPISIADAQPLSPRGSAPYMSSADVQHSPARRMACHRSMASPASTPPSAGRCRTVMSRLSPLGAGRWVITGGSLVPQSDESPQISTSGVEICVMPTCVPPVQLNGQVQQHLQELPLDRHHQQQQQQQQQGWRRPQEDSSLRMTLASALTTLMLHDSSLFAVPGMTQTVSIVRAVEAELYRQALSRSEYADLASLPSRAHEVCRGLAAGAQ